MQITTERLHFATLFAKDRTTVNRHITNIFNEGGLSKKVVCAYFAHTTKHGAVTGKTQEKQVAYYNLQIIIAVGYRVKSLQGKSRGQS